MKPEIKQKFVQALKSGDYEQVIAGPLRVKLDNGKYQYCLLGVLIDLYCRETNNTWKDVVHKDNLTYSEEVLQWSGFRPEDFLYINGVTAYPQIHADHWKIPFMVLGDAIQEQM